MKKSLTICFLCIAVVATNAQYRKDMGKSSVVPLVKVKNTSVQKSVSNLNAKKIYLLQEGFEAGMIPADWTVIDGDGDGWSYAVLILGLTQVCGMFHHHRGYVCKDVDT